MGSDRAGVGAGWLAALGDESLAYTTVMTVLDRLARKGTVVWERHGRAWLYRSAATREAHTRS